MEQKRASDVQGSESTLPSALIAGQGEGQSLRVERYPRAQTRECLIHVNRLVGGAL
jgi:hypothetical protein